MKEAVKEIERGGLGTTLVMTPQNKLSGIITDGDIRRMVASGQRISDLTVEDIMTKNPRALKADSHAYEALNMMEQHQITVIPITNSTGEVQGILHLHDILGKGQFKFNGT
jgi:arabinose-5-phosphate isomerase